MIGEGDDDDECGAIGGMRIGRGNRNTRRKPAPVQLCPPQIPLNQTRDRTRAAAVGMNPRYPLDRRLGGPQSRFYNEYLHNL
jgi:hypothetical protein